jgi:signal transduction histidine kinase
MFFLFVLSCYFIAILSFLMGFFVFLKNKKSKLNQIWSSICFMTAVWSFSLARIVTASNVDEAVFWNWILYWSAIFIPILFFHFTLILISKEKKYRYYYYFFYFFSFLLLFFVPTRYFVAGASPKAGFDYWLDPGILFYVFTFEFFVLVIWSLFLLFKNIKSNIGYKKYQIIYVFIAGLVGFGGGATDFFPQIFNIYPFAHFLVIFYIIFIAYAITRYRLMDIKVLIKRSSVFTFLVMIIAGLLVFFSNLLVLFFENYFGFYNQFIYALISALVVVIFYDHIKGFLQSLTDKIFFVKSYDSAEIFSEINQIALSEIDLEKLLVALEKKLSNIFYFKKVAFLFLDDNKKLKLIKQKGFNEQSLINFAKDKEVFLPLYFNKKNNNIWVVSELKLAYELGDYIPKNKEILFGLYEMDVNLVVPLFVKEDLIGIVLIGDKKSGESYGQYDINTISVIAGQLAMAIENAKLYEKERQFNKKLKEEIKKAVSKLEKANKELQRLDDAKSEFLSIASHQLRTPTTIIKGYISMMQEGSFGKLPKLLRKNLDKVYIATERLLGLIENLLDISRIEAGRLEFNMVNTNLKKIADELKEEFLKKAREKNIKLLVFAPDDLPEVMADLLKIKEVGSNLVDNAIKYTSDGEVLIDLHQEGGSVVFSVIDTGMGMNTEEAGRLFNKFVRGDDMIKIHPEGTGLGLYFARVVIENMGGRIWAESPGKSQGSKFCFSLPLADKKKAIKIKS